MEIQEFIPIGYINRVSRSELVSLTRISDREIRASIESARRKGIVIISSDGGYFQPNYASDLDMEKTLAYIRKERHRMDEIRRSIRALEESIAPKAFYSRMVL